MTTPLGAYDGFAADREVLARIGEVLRDQTGADDARLPAVLAEQAAAAWNRDDPGLLADPETAEQRAVRDDAGVLAMIGMAVVDFGMPDGDEVSVPLDSSLVAGAIAAARRSR